MAETRILDTLEAVNSGLKVEQIDERFPTMYPSGFAGVILQHQARVLQALYDLYSHRVHNIKINKTPTIAVPYAVKYADKLGAGKTLVGLLLAHVVRNSTMPAQPPVIRIVRNASKQSTMMIKSYYDNVLTPVFICVSIAVFRQWQDEAVKFNLNFRFFLLENSNDFKVFKEYVRNGEINKFDVVLIKIGESDKYFEPDEPRQTTSSIQAVKIHMENVGVAARLLLIDDVDTSRVTRITEYPPTLFTVLISATNGTRGESGHQSYDYTDIGLLVQAYSPGVLGSLKDKYLLILQSTKDSIQASTQVPKLICRELLLKNLHDKVLRHLKCMPDETARKALELINGGAVEEAANLIGISATCNPTDIFRKVLKDGYDKFEQGNRGYVLCTAIVEKIKAFVPGDDDEDVNINKEFDKLNELITEYAKKGTKPATPPRIRTNHPQLVMRLIQVANQHMEEKCRAELPLNQMRDNIQQAADGECSICMVDKSAFMTLCCHIFLCEICWKDGMSAHQRKVGNGTFIECRCKYCKTTHVDAAQSSIRIDKEFDIRKLLTAPIEPTQPEVTPTEAAQAPVDPAQPTDPKLAALLQIVNGIEPEGCTERVINAAALMMGDKIIKQEDNKTPSVIVAGSNAAVVVRAEALMAQNKIPFERLGGTPDQIANIVDRFRKREFRVLTIPSNVVCQGLNLECADKMVLMHRLIDEAVEGQLQGRIQRIGRKTSAEIYSLVYENEREEF